jgi:hypothetical protein
LKFRRIKYVGHIAIILFVLCGSWGCLLHPWVGPGYQVDIHISNSASPGHKDVDLTEEVLIKEGFVKRTVNTSGIRTCLVSFKPFAQQTQTASPTDGALALVCFTMANGSFGINDLSVTIYNDVKGQNPALKGEIDRIAEVLQRNLSGHFGKENVTIKKFKTGPPF